MNQAVLVCAVHVITLVVVAFGSVTTRLVPVIEAVTPVVIVGQGVGATTLSIYCTVIISPAVAGVFNVTTFPDTV